MTVERAFVAGATGYTGRCVVEALAGDGIDTIAHVRPDSPVLERWRERFGAMGATVDTTAWEADAMRETLSRLQPTIVFALLGTTRKRMKATHGASTYEAVDYGLTALLADACVAAGIRPRFVYLSAAGVREEAASPYYAARARAEAKLRKSGLPFTIARPSFITGPDREERRRAERFAAAMLDASLAAAAAVGARGPRARWASMSGPELARGLVRCARDPEWEARVAEAEDLRAPSS